MRRRRLPPDTRPRWDQPNLTCYTGEYILSPKQAQFYSQSGMESQDLPNWRLDPSYDWAKQVREKR